MVSNTAATRVAGTLRKRIAIDITTGMAIGLVAGFTWWHVYHEPKNERRDKWYAEYAQAQENK